MVIKRKAVKNESKNIDKQITELIERGGNIIVDKEHSDNTLARFTLRMAQSCLERIDTSRKKRPVKISRNQWILEAIEEMLAVDSN